MKKFSCFMLAWFIISLTACGHTSSSTQATLSPSPGEYSYSYEEDLTSIEDIIRYSTNIVQAELISIEDFDPALIVYTFDVSEDYTNNTPNEIHVYDAYNDAYILGHSYYLFLSSGESALYPHTIYTTVVKDFIIDEATFSMVATSVNDSNITVSSSNLVDQIKTAVSSGIVAQSADTPNLISNSNKIESVSASADIIAEVRVSNEVNANIYSSTYIIEVVSMLKGSAADVPSAMNLPPYLNQNTTYYILLKESPYGDGTYSLFSRSYPVISSTSSIADDLLTD